MASVDHRGRRIPGVATAKPGKTARKTLGPAHGPGPWPPKDNFPTGSHATRDTGIEHLPHVFC